MSRAKTNVEGIFIPTKNKNEKENNWMPREGNAILYLSIGKKAVDIV